MKKFISAVFLAIASISAFAATDIAPDALARSVTDEVLAIVRTDRDLQSGHPQKVAKLVETKVLPHFNFPHMTQLAVGRNWRQATPEQQQKLTNEFRTLLVRTYSNALTQYRDETIDVKPLRADASASDVTVRSEVVRSGRPPVQIDYAMAKTPEGWKAYDVIVGGVSLVTNYRDEFNEQVKAAGVDGLIKTLADKNRGAPGK